MVVSAGEFFARWGRDPQVGAFGVGGLVGARVGIDLGGLQAVLGPRRVEVTARGSTGVGGEAVVEAREGLGHCSHAEVPS